MTTDERRAAKAEVDAARAALVTHMNQMEDAVNVPKKIGRRMRQAQAWAGKQPLAAAGVAAAGAAVIGGIVVAIVRISRR